MKVKWLNLVVVVVCLLVGWGALVSPALAEEDKTFDPVSVTLSMNQDKFFGFYPMLAGTYFLKRDLGIAWGATLYQRFAGHTSDFSNPWTWLYLGIHKSFLDGKLVTRPHIGITNGQLNSCGAPQMGSAGCPAKFAEGFLALWQNHYAGDWIDADLYFVLVQDLRHSGTAHNSFTHQWFYLGVPVLKTASGSKLIVGGYYEDVHAVGSSGNPCTGCLASGSLSQSVLPAGPLFTWVGGYVEWRMTKGMSMFFAAGKDLLGDGVNPNTGGGVKGFANVAGVNPGGDFYKVRFSKTF